jgi:16S rRNA (guanine527-N7)-methyltransferase
MTTEPPPHPDHEAAAAPDASTPGLEPAPGHDAGTEAEIEVEPDVEAEAEPRARAGESLAADKGEPDVDAEAAALKAEINAVFKRHKLELAERETDDLMAYLLLIEHWNARINLTAIRERQAAILRHLLEPVLMRDHLAGAGPRLVDAGSGVGVPGIPLAITDRDRDIILVEANNKKVAFLHEVVEALRLDRVKIIDARLEEAIASGALEGPIHVLASRGWTSGWGELLGHMAPLMAPGGRAMLLTGEQTERALRRQLARGVQQAPSNVPEWRAAAAAGWWIRRAAPLPHLERGYLVTLELPTP